MEGARAVDEVVEEVDFGVDGVVALGADEEVIGLVFQPDAVDGVGDECEGGAGGGWGCGVVGCEVEAGDVGLEG